MLNWSEKFSVKNKQTLFFLHEYLKSIEAKTPEEKAKLVLLKAIEDAKLRDEDPNKIFLLDSIQERACIRWAEGFSDSLFDAVLCNIKPLHETVEYSDDLDEGKIVFLHKIGFSYEEIQSKGMGRKLILKPRTDWETELNSYKE